jgi:hypothetical protein
LRIKKNFANKKEFCELKNALRTTNEFCEWYESFATQKNIKWSKFFRKRWWDCSKKNFRLKEKKENQKKMILYVKFDVRITDENFCEMIWLSRFYDFYVFYERVSLFNQFVIRILCNLRTHFFVWSMSYTYFTNAFLCSMSHSCFMIAFFCLISLSFVNLLSHQFAIRIYA